MVSVLIALTMLVALAGFAATRVRRRGDDEADGTWEYLQYVQAEVEQIRRRASTSNAA